MVFVDSNIFTSLLLLNTKQLKREYCTLILQDNPISKLITSSTEKKKRICIGMILFSSHFETML